ncbi:MAG TPA: hypothetical protein PKJ10_05345 [Smithella sp.]|nr:hypothetical protein [Smithella sp.]
MKKKIHPEDQTKELNRANLEFLKCNKKEYKNIMELVEKNEKARDEFTTYLSMRLGQRSKEYKDSWDVILKDEIFVKELKDKITKIEIPPAANATYPFERFGIDVAYKVMIDGGKDIFHMSKDTRNKKYLDYLCQHAREIFTELTNGEPSNYLLVGIDLRRNKDVILKEFENLPMINNLSKIKALSKKIPNRRLKWLSSVDEILEVWKLYGQAGRQPGKLTFKDIKKIVNRPLSTIKDQWCMAYEKIFGIPYTRESKYISEEKRADATQLCSKCPHGAKCYRGNDWYPCSAYLEIAGKEKNIKYTEYNDNILYDNQE